PTLGPARRADRLSPQERQGEARRAAVALGQLLACIDEYLDARALEPAPRLAVALQHQGDAGREREHVRANRLELLVRHLHQLDAALPQELRQPDGEERVIADGEIAIEGGEEREQVHDLAFAMPVGEVEDEYLDPRQRSLDAPDPVRVGPVAATGKQRVLVQADEVATFRDRRPPETLRNGNAGRLERGS